MYVQLFIIVRTVMPTHRFFTSRDEVVCCNAYMNVNGRDGDQLIVLGY